PSADARPLMWFHWHLSRRNMEGPPASNRPLLGFKLPRHLGRPLVARSIPRRHLSKDGQHIVGITAAEAGNASNGDVLAGPHTCEAWCLMIGTGDADLVLPELCDRDIGQRTAAIACHVLRLLDRLERHGDAA